MEYRKLSLPAFCVLGKEGSTDDGADFISALWAEANSRYEEVAHLAVHDESGNIRIWGLMSDMSMSFAPWENGFTKGRYLAGIEVSADTVPPEGWSKWTSPACEYVVTPMDSPDSFPLALEFLSKNGLTLVGAAYDRIIPGEGTFIYLPIKKL